MSSPPPMDERQMRKQQIRPRFLDLAEFDDDMPDSSRRAALDSFTNWPPAATVVRKKPPTIASSSKADASASKPEPEAKAPLKPTVEDVEDLQAQPSHRVSANEMKEQAQIHVPSQPQPRTVRFTSDTANQSEDAEKKPTPPKATLDFAGSIIGTIQERPAGERRTRQSGSSRTKPSGSRFVVRRRMDEDLQKHEEQRQQRLQSESTPAGQEPGTGFPEVHHRDQIAPILPPVSGKQRAVQYSEDIDTVEAPQRDSLATQTALAQSAVASTQGAKANSAPEDEEWLDEDGKPMSAFRKSRLLRQGLRPPSVRLKGPPAAEDRHIPDFKPDPTRDPGGGADIDAISAVLSDVARENDQKLRQMSAAEVSEEIRSLESLFGKDILDALRNRKSGSTSKESGPATVRAAPSTTETKAKDDTSGEASKWEVDDGGPLAIKRQYFPAEPEGPNPSLEWMMPQHSSQSKSKELRFDFSGRIIERNIQTDETYLSGLHHHGDDQEAPGYTFSELVHLSRSTVAAQRQLALNVLGRICEQYPAFSGDANLPSSASAAKLLDDHALLFRARVLSLSRWLLGDRHFTVRAAALRCLTSTIRSLPAGVSLPLGASQELDFGTLLGSATAEADDSNRGAEASEVETAIQKDWAKVMIESHILGLFLDKTDSVITSTWEAELALELLVRIASCSGTHASQLFETEPSRLCDFIIHLGLKVSWPPVPTDGTPARTQTGRSSSLPSLMAVRLLHQGILSDRKVAESIVMSGSIEHLLRFVVTPPWKVEEDWASDDEEGDAIVLTAHQIFDEVLQLFTSLASYGFFASVVARTWSMWQESTSWALGHIAGDHDAKHSASRRAWAGEARSTAAQRIFEVLGAWTHCAMDPHELMTAHDITWTQVRDWIETVKDAALRISEKDAASRSSSMALSYGALCAYIDSWLRCALSKEPKLLSKYLDSCKTFFMHSQQPVQTHFLQVTRLFSSAPTQGLALEEAKQACLACHRYLDLSTTVARAEQIASNESEAGKSNAAHSPAMLEEGLALISCGDLWQALDSPQSRASGRQVYRDTFSNFVAAAVTAHSSGSRSDQCRELAAVTRLDAQHASLVAQIVMKTTEALSGASIAHTLRPFLLECIVGTNRLLMEERPNAPEHRSSTPLSQVKTLFKEIKTVGTKSSTEKVEGGAKDDDIEEDRQEDQDTDPITGNRLWKCPASGLPLRADWPLLALDDLLHSAHTAVFNRPENLEADWKPSELDMVRASLELAVAVFRALLERSIAANSDSSKESQVVSTAEASAMSCSLPSPEQILLGVMKVFMLEKDQPDTFTDKNATGAAQQKQTGVLTGRDLFRDPAISSSLALLLDIADQLVDLRQSHRDQVTMSSTTLDEWTASTYGGGMSFYQFFTDLVGLWDSVSFGDANFARVVMTVANAGCTGGLFEGQHGVAVDFRRLVWNDYSDSLKSMPALRVAGWLLGWTDKDVDMLEHYCRYLVSTADVTASRHSIAWQIAAHHVGAAFRSLNGGEKETGDGQTKRVESILKSLLAAKGEPFVREVLDALPKSTPSSQEDLQHLFARLGLP